MLENDGIGFTNIEVCRNCYVLFLKVVEQAKVLHIFYKKRATILTIGNNA